MPKIGREGEGTWRRVENMEGGGISETQVVSRIHDGYSGSELNLGCRSLIAKTFCFVGCDTVAGEFTGPKVITHDPKIRDTRYKIQWLDRPINDFSFVRVRTAARDFEAG